MMWQTVIRTWFEMESMWHPSILPYLLVVHDLARLHGAHDRGVDGVLPVLGHVLHHPLLLVRQRRQHDLSTQGAHKGLVIQRGGGELPYWQNPLYAAGRQHDVRNMCFLLHGSVYNY
jgi:hypothetical protein